MAENTELMTVDNICNRVYVIRGQQVMLDYDLAEIYGYEVKRLNEQVKRNSARFPEDFMFQLTKTEIPEEFSKSQIATLNENGDRRGTNIKKLPFAFTEQGIYMLATVLRGELAEQQSIFIMRAFREMRHYIKQNQQFVTQSEMRLVTAKVSEISVQVAGISDWKKKTESDIVSKMWKLFCLQRMVMVALIVLELNVQEENESYKTKKDTPFLNIRAGILFSI